MRYPNLGIGWALFSAGVISAVTIAAVPAIGQTTKGSITATTESALVADTASNKARSDGNEHVSNAAVVAVAAHPADINEQIFHKNKLEFSLEGGMLPFNIPFPFDFLLGDGYNMTPLHYTVVPILASLRWQTGNVGGPWMLRGTWELSFSALITPIARGPETHYIGYAMGIRRNFVRPNWRAVPFAEFRAGLGGEDAKGPKGVVWAQGQDFAFTLMMDSGLRYRINPKYAVWAGVQWMHISNLYMSEPRYLNYGINTYGPVVGVDVALRMRQRRGGVH
jgi:hypothetical protein